MSVFTSQDINVKCRAMYSKLLDRNEYDTLLRCTSVSQITEYLKKDTPYSYVLRRFDVDDTHRGQLEQVLKRSLYYDYERLINFSSGSYKAALRACFESFEVDDLKLVISSICSEHEHLLTIDDLTYVRHYGNFSPQELLGHNTMRHLVDYLLGSRYHKMLEPLADMDPPDFQRIDHVLSAINHNAIMSAFKRALGGAGRRVAMSVYGIQADIGDIMFIYRIKKLYRFASQDIIQNLSFVCHKIKRQQLVDLANCASFDEFSDTLSKTRYARLFPKELAFSWEKIHADYFCRLHKRNLRRYGGNIGVVLAYLYLKENDIRNIIIIVEGVRYEIPPDEITTLLAGYF